LTDLEWLISTDSNSALKGGKKRDICFRIKAVISQEKNSGMYTAMYTVVSPSGEEERWQYTPNSHFDIARAALNDPPFLEGRISLTEKFMF